MGDVYLARDLAFDRDVAVKFLRNPGNPESFERFLLELRVLAKLEHPHLIRVFQSDVLRSTPFFTMEHLAGGSLADVLKSPSGEPHVPPLEESLQLIRRVAAACDLAHAQKIVHRDLKPSNILLAPDGTPKVADFGLAKRLDDSEGPTLTNGALGTPSYMPPEQISSKHGDIGPWSDVYGLGATLYHQLTGRAPFRGGNPAEVIAQVLRAPPVRPRAIRAELPLGLEAVILKCLEKNPRNRYQTIAEFLADLDKYEAGLQQVAPLATPTRRLRRWARWHRVKFAGAGIATAAAIGLVVLGRALAPIPHPPLVQEAIDPTAAKTKWLEEIREAQTSQKPLVLLGEKGSPKHHEWLLGPAQLGESPIGDGACYFQAAGGLSMLQLFEPPKERYRLKFQLQQIGAELDGGLTAPSIGIFLGHTPFTRASGPPARGFLLVNFFDFDQNAARDNAPAPQHLRFDWTHLVPPPNGLASFQSLNLAHDTFHARDTFPGRWWTFVVDVDADALVIRSSRDGEQERQLANLRRTTVREALQLYKIQAQVVQQQAQVPIDFGPLPEDWNPTGGAGIWCVRSRVAIKNVAFFPLP